MERRLAAILAADVVGYSRLIETDEGRTLAAMRKLRCEVIDPSLAIHHGRIVKVMGDGVIAEFSSVVDAVSCAVAVQTKTAEAQVGTPAEHSIVFRIGINLGDVVVEGEDLLGDGVNVASRLEQICEPGGIFVSGTAYDHLQGKLNVPLDYQGEQHLKNITRPVRIYDVRLDKSRQGRWHLSIRRIRWSIPAAVALTLLIGGAGFSLIQWGPRGEPLAQHTALTLPNKPSLAVLPFDNLSPDPQQGYFADGITDDLITDLSKLSGLFVIARNSTWTYKGKPTKIQQVGSDLGVRYVLEGSVQRQGDQIRINAQLIDAANGEHLWADRYDGAMNQVFALQDKVIHQIVEALAVRLTGREATTAAEAETNNVQAYDAVLRGWDYLRSDNEVDTLKAIALFETAIKLDPDYGRAYASLAKANLRIVLSGWEAASGSGWEHAYEAMTKSLAQAMSRPTPLAYAVSADILWQKGLYGEASEAINKALELAPNDPENHVSYARILNATGHASEAEAAVRKALRLDPRFAPNSLRVLAISLFNQQKFEMAVDTLQRVVNQQSDWAADYDTLAASLGYLGHTEQAAEAIRKYNAISVPSGFDPLTVQENGWWWDGDMFNYDAAYRAGFLEGLRKAGVPEGSGTDLALDDYKHLITRSDGLYRVAGVTEIEPIEAKSLYDAGGAVFIDVRAESTFKKGHIPGAINLSLPVQLSKESLAKFANRIDKIVFSCTGKYCPYSPYAAAKARLWGYSQVYRFAGGFPAWKDAGYPVEPSLQQ